MAVYHIPLGDSGDSVEMRMSFFAGARFSHRGQKVKLGLFSPYQTVTGTDGRNYRLGIVGHFLDTLPGVSVNGKEVDFAPRLPRWGYVFSGLGLLLALLGVAGPTGLLGVVLGMVAFYLAQNAIRAINDRRAAFLAAAGIVLGGWALWYAASALILLLFGSGG